MAAGFLISGVGAGLLGLLIGLALQVGLPLAGLWYIAGGFGGCLIFLNLALRSRDRESV